MIDCERDLSEEMANRRKEDLVCKKCTIKQIGGGQYDCKIHGHQHITWKCHKCCREATYYCGGMSYLCDKHHDVGGPLEDCGGVDCPLGVPHPPANHDPKLSLYPLGCSLCKSKKKTTTLNEIDQLEVDLEEQKEQKWRGEEMFKEYTRLNPFESQAKMRKRQQKEREEKAKLDKVNRVKEVLAAEKRRMEEIR